MDDVFRYKIPETEYGRTDLLCDFVAMYYDYMNTVRDYGTGKSYSMTEVHMVTRIADNPGITVTELSGIGNRTKSAISQLVKKLALAGLIVKANHPDGGRKVLLYATPEGMILSQAHKAYDENHGTHFDELSREKLGSHAVDDFYAVLRYFMQSLQNNSIEK